MKKKTNKVITILLITVIIICLSLITYFIISSNKKPSKLEETITEVEKPSLNEKEAIYTSELYELIKPTTICKSYYLQNSSLDYNGTITRSDLYCITENKKELIGIDELFVLDKLSNQAYKINEESLISELQSSNIEVKNLKISTIYKGKLLISSSYGSDPREKMSDNIKENIITKKDFIYFTNAITVSSTSDNEILLSAYYDTDTNDRYSIKGETIRLDNNFNIINYETELAAPPAGIPGPYVHKFKLKKSEYLYTKWLEFSKAMYIIENDKPKNLKISEDAGIFRCNSNIINYKNELYCLERASDITLLKIDESFNVSDSKILASIRDNNFSPFNGVIEIYDFVIKNDTLIFKTIVAENVSVINEFGNEINYLKDHYFYLKYDMKKNKEIEKFYFDLEFDLYEGI